MKKSNIYTRTGDKGETGLVSGTRTLKSDSRIDMYGDLDELNSRVGVVISLMSEYEDMSEIKKHLEDVQCSLFDLGSNLACEADKRDEWKLPQISKNSVTLLEDKIDEMESELTPLKTFILPGGHFIASQIHLCRTCSRSVERKMVDFMTTRQEPLPENSLIFMNRLSDYFFVLARWVNKHFEINETPWKRV
ncbi:MAG: cob(I)yrinic acid a,c-diamide adenosyltransferase [Bacteriovoracia bacterium]